jgi:hypothetical protein
MATSNPPAVVPAFQGRIVVLNQGVLQLEVSEGAYGNGKRDRVARQPDPELRDDEGVVDRRFCAVACQVIEPITPSIR